MASKKRRLSKASFSEFRRLSPAENIRTGHTPKARQYVLAMVKRVTKSTPTISARQYETKRSIEKHNLLPEQATEARKRGAISYVSLDQRLRVAKAIHTGEIKRSLKKLDGLAAKNAKIKNNSPHPKYRRKGSGEYKLSSNALEQFLELARRHDAGETLAQKEFSWMMDVAEAIDYPDIMLLRGSPGAFSVAA